MKFVWAFTAAGRALAIFGSVAAVAGCAVLASYPDNPKRRDYEGLQGNYFLPRTLLTIKVVPEAAGDNPSDGKANGEVAGGRTAVATPEKPADGKPSGGDQPSPAPGSVTVERVTLATKTDADPDARLRYKLLPSSISDDVIQVDTDERGLLAAVSSVTTDRSGDIAQALAELVFTIATGGAAPPSKGVTAAQAGKPKPLPFEATFDPFDDREAKVVRNRLLDMGYCLLIGGRTQSGATDANCSKRAAMNYEPEAARRAVEYAAEHPGIFYRRAEPVRVQLYKKNEGKWTALWVGSAPVFQKGDLYEVSIDRAAFVKKDTTIKFTNGTLTTVKLDKPSEVVGFVSIPVKVARVIFAIPLAGLQQETSLNKAQAELLNSQANLLTAQANLVKLQQQQVGNSVVATPAAR